MKKFIALSITLLLSVSTFSQVNPLPVIYLNENVSTHFVSKLNIDYTDLSTNEVVGDNPMKNIVRIKPKRASGNLGIATIVGESFFLQFRLVYTQDIDMAHTHIDLDNRKDFRPLSSQQRANVTKGKVAEIVEPEANYDNPNYTLTHTELASHAAKLEPASPSLNNVVSKKYRMHLKLNNIWVVDDYLYFDYTAHNKANIPYTIDEIRYKIIDSKIVKATSNQDRLIEPDFVLNKETFTDGKFRNIVAFKKFTFPNDKSFIIEIAEDQISGRKITLEMSYSDLLSAKTFKSKAKDTK